MPSPSAAELDVVCVTSENYEPVFRIFRESCARSQDIRLHVRELDLRRFRVYGFGSLAWRHAILSKLSFVVEMLGGSIAPGAHVAVSDADVQFVAPDRLSLLFEHARRDALDFYGMKEGTSTTYNGGFYIIRNTEAVRTFMVSLLRSAVASKRRYVDQEALNELICSSTLKHRPIDVKYCIWGNASPCADSILHHAVGALTTESKASQMKTVAAKCRAIRLTRVSPPDDD